VKLVDIKTFIPELQVWVSTIARNEPLWIGCYAETMVFKGNEHGITDWHELYFENHGDTTDRATLEKEHNRIVNEIKSGAIKIDA